MPKFTVINHINEINLNSKWVDSAKFNSKNRIVDGKGKAIGAAYAGRRYQLVAKKQRGFSKPERIGRGVLGTLAVVGSLGFALLSKRIRKLFTKQNTSIRFATPNHLAQNPLPKPNLPTSEPKIEPIKIPDPIPPAEPSKEIEEAIPARSLPEPPSGVIKNGYGEYLIYRMTPEGQKEPIAEDEHEKIFDELEECRSLTGNQIPDDRHAYLKTKVQDKLGPDVHIAFTPRIIYELIYLKECIQEDLDYKRCSNARQTGILEVFDENEDRDKQQLIEKSMRKGFWQQCLFDDTDYATQFAPKNAFDYRKTHLRRVAARLNQVAVNRFKASNGIEGFTFDEIRGVERELTAFFKELHDPQSELHAKADRISKWTYAGIAKECAEETTKLRGNGADQFPMGIGEERHAEIVQKTLQLECSVEAVNQLILYRGANFSGDALTRKESINISDSPVHANSLSYGTSLYAGALYDGGATAFHYMRQPGLDAQAILVPLKQQQASQTPFHAYNVHPLIQVMSKGEIFHARTKVWNLNSEDTVLGFIGVIAIPYSKVKNSCRTNLDQVTMENSFKEYKNNAYILANKQK